MIQPGDLLSYVIRETTGLVAGSCGSCRECITEMNENGWWWCWRNRDKIENRLIEAARQRNILVTKQNAHGLVTAAFREFFNYRKQKGNMRNYVIRTTKVVIGAKTTKEALAQLDKAETVAINVFQNFDASSSIPVTETAGIEAESIEEAFAKRNEAETASVQVGQLTSPKAPPPPPSNKGPQHPSTPNPSG